MAIAPVDAIGGLGAEFSIPAVDGPEQAPASGSGFGDMLGKALGELSSLHDDAAAQSQALATGRAEDISQVVMSVERAALGLQLASQVRNKAVEAYHDLMRMQV